MNLLTNPSFEDTGEQADQHKTLVITPDPAAGQASYWTQRGEINNPKGWLSWYVHDKRPPEHDPHNDVGWAEPEVRLAPHPGRQRTGDYGLLMFTFNRIHDGGAMQQRKTTAGKQYQAYGYAHAWTGNNVDPMCSVGVGCNGFAAREGETEHDQATFRVGIDPTGGMDPLADSVVWGQGAHIYNVYARVPAVEFVAESDKATIFTRQTFLYPFKHNDGYIDDIVLELVDEEPPEPPQPDECPQPRDGWDTRVSVLVAFDADTNAWHSAAQYADHPDRQHDVCRSWDHAFWSPGLERVIIKLWFHKADAFDIDEVRAWGAEEYPMINAEIVAVGPHAPDDGSGGEPPEEPPNTRRLLGFHGIGEGDIIRHLARFKDAGLVGPTCKSYGQPSAMMWLRKVKEVDDRVITVGRLGDQIDGVNIAGMDMGNPVGSANLHYQTCKPYWEERPYVDYWETLNEQKPESPEQAKAQAQYYLRLMDLVEADGFKLAIFSYSLGVPEPECWDAIAETDLFRRAYEGGHVLSLHEYGRFPKDAGHILGRFTDLYDRHLLPDWPIPLLITEYNVDEKAAGEGLHGYTYEEWLAQMQQYDALLRQYSYVLGAHIFTLGSIGKTWSRFDPDKFKRENEASWTDGLVDWQIETADDVPEPPVEPPDPPEPPALTLMPFFQRDSRWSGIKLGGTQHTIGGSGCTTVAYASLLTMVIDDMDPLKLVTWLNRNSGYTYDGLLWMTKPFLYPGVSACMKYIRYHTWRNPGQVADLKIVRRLLDNGPTVIQVDFYPETEPLDSHFVLALRMVGDDDIEVMDPWTGRVVKLMQTYGGKRTLAASIFTAVEWEWVSMPPAPPAAPERGVHGAPTPNAPADIPGLVAALQGMQIKWFKMLDNGDSRNVELVKALKAAGIEPIVRLWRGHHLPDNVPNVDNVGRLIQVGARFIEVVNEPNLSIEWDGRPCSWQNPADIAAVGETWMVAARRVVEMGGAAGLMAWAPTDRSGTHPQYSSQMWTERCFAWLNEHHGAEIRSWQRAGQLWLAVHTVAMARPLDYNPRRSWGVDDMCLRGYEVVRERAFATFGEMPVISTEGGVFSPYHLNQLWPDCVRGSVVYAEGTDDPLYTELTWGEYILKANAAVDIPLCHWHLRDIGNEWDGGGWYTQNGTPRSPVIALSR
jgi:hypothetical protein